MGHAVRPVQFTCITVLFLPVGVRYDSDLKPSLSWSLSGSDMHNGQAVLTADAAPCADASFGDKIQ